MSRYSTLLADDVPELRKLLRQVLEWSERFEVVAEAANGLEAVELTERHRPDLVLLDISMPVLDGMGALPRLTEVSPKTKIVILSGFEAGPLEGPALAGGASAFIEKGIAPGELVSRLLKILDGGAPERSPFSERRMPSSLLDIPVEEMMSLVAHEIRNPLAVIQGFGTELQNRWERIPDSQRLDAVTRMTERARYLNTVVNNLMSMRRLEAAHEWAEPRPASVAELVERLVDELVELARDRELTFEVEPNLPDVLVDTARLRQVMTNLTVNAAKFSPSGTPVQLFATSHPSGVALKVVDQGPGIPEDQREAIFGKFKRLQKGGSGIGLGLYISRALVRSMSGDLWVEDAAPGARFVCSLPVADRRATT
ncbi:MAG: ATP-binding response regulator [Actinomycetota bacterium]